MQTWHFVGIATMAVTVTVTVTVDVLWGTAFHLAAGVLFTNGIDIAAAAAVAAVATVVAGGGGGAAAAGAASHQRCHSTRFLCFLSLFFPLFRPYDTN